MSTVPTHDQQQADMTKGAGVAGGRKASRNRRHDACAIGKQERLEIALLSGPAILLFVTFVIFPVIMAAYYGFFKWKGFGIPTNFVGLKNYITILTDPEFHAVLGHNAIILVASLLIQGPIALGLALLLNKKMKGQSLIRVLIFIPYVISEVIAGTATRPLTTMYVAIVDVPAVDAMY